MAKNVSYTCDRCNHTQDTEEQMWETGVLLRHTGSRQHYSINFTPQFEQLWCRKCVESIGLLAPPKSERKEPIPSPTLEDMIRDIVSEEISNAENRSPS